MNNFRTNYSELLLLANRNIKVWDSHLKLEFEILPMKVKDLFLDSDLIWFLGFLETDLQDITFFVKEYELKSHFEFIQLVCAISEVSEETRSLSKSFVSGLQKIVPEIELKGKLLTIKNFTLTKEIFDYIFDIVFKIMHKKPKVKIVDGDDEMTQKMKKVQQKIAEIKSKGRRMNESGTNFEDMFAALLYEYPQYKMEDLFELNIYTFYYLFKYVGKIANYEVSKIAAGNGLSKKHKYFIEK